MRHKSRVVSRIRLKSNQGEKNCIMSEDYNSWVAMIQGTA